MQCIRDLLSSGGKCLTINHGFEIKYITMNGCCSEGTALPLLKMHSTTGDDVVPPYSTPMQICLQLDPTSLSSLLFSIYSPPTTPVFCYSRKQSRGSDLRCCLNSKARAKSLQRRTSSSTLFGTETRAPNEEVLLSTLYSHISVPLSL